MNARQPLHHSQGAAANSTEGKLKKNILWMHSYFSHSVVWKRTTVNKNKHAGGKSQILSSFGLVL